ncbi:MAG: hypothetical protein RL088_3907 [Verrucomicrobiota bacterium]
MDSARGGGRGKVMNTQPTSAAAGRRTEFVGTFIKASGAARTMRFTTSPDKLRGGGLITVFDVERGGLRKFNLATLVGRLSAVTAEGQLSFCA